MAVSRQVSKVAELCAGHRGYTSDDGGGGGGRKRNKRGRKSEPGPDASPKAKKKKVKAATPESGKRVYLDAEGELGPNGLARRKGGNPKGQKCARFARDDCAYDTCSSSHVK